MADSLRESLQSSHDLTTVLNLTLSTSLLATEAPFGDIQLLNWKTGCLEIVAHHGVNDEFLKFFERVGVDDGSACGRALKAKRTIVVEDVNREEECAPCRSALLDASVVAIQSTPIISSGGILLGMLSVLFPKRHRLSDRESSIVGSIAQIAAEAIIVQHARQPMNGVAISPLSTRECEILQWIVRGKSSSEIGEILNISKRTVDQHVSNACDKTGVANRLQLIGYAVRNNLVTM